MATDLERLVVQLSADVRGYERELRRAQGITDRSARQIETRFRTMNRNISGIGANFARGLVGGIAGGLAAALGTREIAQAADSYTRMSNALRLVTTDAADAQRVMSELTRIALAQNTPIEALVNLYSRLGLSADQIGADSAELLEFTEKVSAALKLQGVSAQEASGALIQLSQALGGGVVRAEEFNSIIEGVPEIARAVARGLREAGGSVAELRKLVIDGQVSSQAFFEAFRVGAEQTVQAAAAMDTTISGALTNFATAFTLLIGETNSSTEAGQRLITAINGLADVLGDPSFRQFTSNVLAALIEQFDRFIDDVQQAPIAAAQFARDFNIQIQNVIAQLARLRTALRDAINLPPLPQDVAAVAREQALILDDASQTFKEATREFSDADTAAADRISQTFDTIGTSAEEATPKVDALQERLQQLANQKQIELTGELIAAPATTPAARTETTHQPPVSIQDFPIAEKNAAAKDREAAARERNADAAEREREQVTDLISDLEFELSLVGLSAEQQRILTEQRQAGAAATEEQRARIAELVGQIEAENAAEEALVDRLDSIRSTAGDALSAFNNELRQGEGLTNALKSALDRVLDSLLRIAEQQIISSIFGNLGGTGGGLFGNLFGGGGGLPALTGGGLFQRGGIATRPSIFGEAGPEAAVPLPDGRSIPVMIRVPNLPRGAASPGVQINRTINNYAGVDVRERDEKTPRGIDQTIDILERRMDKKMSQKYGLRPVLTRRGVA